MRICEIRGRFLIGVLSGGAAVPAAPTEQSYLPTDFTEFTELLSGGAAVPAAPTKHSCTNIVILPRNPQNSQKLLAEKSFPRISQLLTDL